MSFGGDSDDPLLNKFNRGEGPTDLLISGDAVSSFEGDIFLKFIKLSNCDLILSLMSLDCFLSF